MNNIFMDRDLQTHSAPNTFGLAFERNLLIADSIEILTPKGNPEGLSSDFDTSEHMKGYSAADGIISLKNNIFCSKNGRIVCKEYLHYKVNREAVLKEKVIL